MANKPKLVLTVILLAELGYLLVVAFLAYSRYPTNHWGADIRWAAVLGVLGVVYGLLFLAKAQKKAGVLLATSVSLLFMGLIYSAERLNVLVRYDRWVERGMPPSPFSKTVEGKAVAR